MTTDLPIPLVASAAEAPELLPPAGYESYVPRGGIVEVFFARADELGARPFLHHWSGDGWVAWSWESCARHVAALAAALRRLGVAPGDRVVLAAENSVEWQLSDLAILGARAITVPLSLAGGAEEWAAIVADVAPAACVVSAAQVARLRAALPPGHGPVPLVVIGSPVAAGAHAWAELAAGAAARPVVAEVVDDVCCLIYTSGTGGTPKGVAQTHRALLWNAIGGASNLRAYGGGDERLLSFLPLSHTYEHTGSFITPLAMGAQVFVSRGVEHLARELVTARPTLLLVVPRFCEVMQQRITTALRREPRWRQWLFATTLRVGERPLLGQPVGVAGSLWLATAGALVRAQLRRKFGGALKCMLSAGAPLRADTCRFFNALGVALHQAYGQTETAPGITMQRRGAVRPDNVGAPMAGMAVQLAPDGEVLVRGPNVMRGYWRDPALTARALAGGWLHTGDIGRLEPDGSLVIIDRKKDFLKTAGGEMIAPQPIEVALAAQPGVGQALVCGDGWPHLGVLLVPDTALREALAGGALSVADVTQRLQTAVDVVNRGLVPKQRVRRLGVILEPFTVENGLLTSTLKVRRRAALAAHAAVVRGLGEGA